MNSDAWRICCEQELSWEYLVRQEPESFMTIDSSSIVEIVDD